MNPKIGIVAPAHRPKNWMNLYKSVGDNNIEFEFVFVGPNRPDYELPENFHFIKTDVKPIQCLEIAIRNTSADYIIPIADDCEFVTPHPLDRLYEAYKAYNSQKVIVSSKMMTDGEDQSHFAHRFFVDQESPYVMPLCGLMSKKYYNDLGGMDKNFIAVMWDVDLGMRVYASGGKVVMVDVYVNENKSKSEGSNLCNEFREHDRAYLESLWTTNRRVHLNRKGAVKSFSDVDILIASQGPRGRWRGNAPVFVEKTQDYLSRFRLFLKRINRGIRQPSKYFSYIKRMAGCLKGKP